MRWAEIGIETTAQAQDAVAELLMENGCGGTAISGDAPVTVMCYLPVDDRLEERLLSIKAKVNNLAGFGLEAGSGEITIKYAEDEDWAEAWKQFFHTLRIGKRIVIKPTWEEYRPQFGDLIIEIDPGMAFGTGNHPTTQLCLELLEKHLKRRSVVVDFGSGSGILALAAAKLGASLVIAFDSDEIAVQSARKNVVQNHLEEIIEVHRTDNPSFISSPVNLVTANLIAQTIIAQSTELARLLRVGGTLIASGIIQERSAEVQQALRDAGFEILETPSEGEWVAVAAKRL